MIKKIIPAIILISFALTGCVSVYTLTTEEEDLIAEYAAGAAIRKFKEVYGFIDYIPDNSQSNNDTGNNMDISEDGMEASDINGSATDETNADTDVELNVADIGSLLNITGVELEYTGYSVEDRYPVEEYSFSTEAGEGHKLIVVRYDVWNSVDADETMKIDTEDVIVRAQINNSGYVNATKTLLNNDILNMDGTKFAPGEVKEGVIIFRVTDEEAENIVTFDISIRNR